MDSEQYGGQLQIMVTASMKLEHKTRLGGL
jgi:hypothetical protein